MEEYKILWVDDQHNDKKMIDFLVEAEGEGLILEGYASFEEAFDVLSKDISRFDVILLDGMFFEKKDQVAGTEDEAGIGMAIAKINELKGQKYFPWFVLSGKDEFTKGKNSILSANKARCFDKTNPKDVTALFDEIKKAAKQQADAQIRHKYQRIFEVCTDKYIGSKGTDDLLSILKKENIDNPFENPNLYFVPIRQIMEDIFKSFNKYGFLPDCFIKPNVAIDESADFLAGKIEKGYQLDGPVFPNIIAIYVFNILKVCQPAAHRSDIDTFIRERNSSYSLLSVTYQTLDLLLWLKDYLDKHPDPSTNKTKYKLVGTGSSAKIIEGVIEQDRSGNYYCDDIIITYTIMKNMGYKLGDKIRIINPANNTKEITMHLYKYSAITSEKL